MFDGRVWFGSLALCVALFATDAFYHKHVRLWPEEWFGFYAVYGFIACIVLVLAARALRWLIMRPGNYYDEDDV